MSSLHPLVLASLSSVCGTAERRPRLFCVLGGNECQPGDREGKVHDPVNSAIGCVFERSKGRAKAGASYVSIQTKSILETLELLKKKKEKTHKVRISCVTSCTVLSLSESLSFVR